MKINKEKVKERLEGVPENKRSHIYNASIVLEFLAQTFMPTRFFLPVSFSPEPGMPLGEKSMRGISADKNITIGDLYNLYLLFREEKDYTAKIESRYTFGIVIKNLRYYKNDWEFVAWRVGTAQLWHIGPLKLRSEVPAEARTKFAAIVERKTVEAGTVEADPVSEAFDKENELRDEECVDMLLNGCSTEYTRDDSRFVEATGESRFVEAIIKEDY